ncbi:hypothetical protein D7004_01800 [Pedobacter jejuensis]|uniref:Uncharacterized protein n=1 Tax=Pedobacter jejuensis TaxID=1268550 RepID=A0A3N0C3R5_9SPHI|nr:hypothetical protein D7004_01800 [Pedobacter jejuensis]
MHTDRGIKNSMFKDFSASLEMTVGFLQWPMSLQNIKHLYFRFVGAKTEECLFGYVGHKRAMDN